MGTAWSVGGGGVVGRCGDGEACCKRSGTAEPSFGAAIGWDSISPLSSSSSRTPNQAFNILAY